MSNILTFITEDDLRRYARGEAPDDVAEDIEALVRNDGEACKRLAEIRKAQSARRSQS